MPAKPQRDGAKKRGDDACQAKGEYEPEPGRGGIRRRQPSGRVGADADERRLAERRQSADAGEQHDAERHQRVNADIIEERDGEFGGPKRRREQDHNGRDQQDRAGAKLHPSTSASSSSVWSSDSDRHNSTGISTLKTITSLSELLQNDAKLSRRPM